MKLKTKLQTSQSGSALIVAMVAVILIVAVSFTGYRILQNKDRNETTASKSTSQTGQKTEATTQTKYIPWSYNGDSWMALNESKPAPECQEPLTISAPMDVTKATSVLYPGQVRGGDYKPHGGMGNDNAIANKVDVKMPYTAYLYRGAKYREQGEIQYLLDFIAPCGIMIRLDHLKKLSPEMEALTQSLPTGGDSDSRTTQFQNNELVKEGSIVAVEVGFANQTGAFFDLGVYDLRKPNAASKDPAFANEPKRKADKEQSYFSVCWFDLLTGQEKTAVASLPARGSEGKTSDFCK